MLKITRLAVVATMVLGCGHEVLTEEGAQAEAVVTPTITFGADWSQRVTGTIVAGQPVRIDYAASRLSQCRGETNNLPAWAITGFFRVNGGASQTFRVAPDLSTPPAPVLVTLPNATGRLEMWFQVTNRWGCNAWDSNYGSNYRFTVSADPRAPGWIGDGAVVINRATCAGGYACDANRVAITTPFNYETYARQRAAIRVVNFDVWKAGVTDFDNPELWRQLDVQVRFRYGGSTTWQTRYVNFERRIGNNARYALDLRSVDPLPDGYSATPCPAYGITASPDGAYVGTTFEYYFTVNGVEYRPSATTYFTGNFWNYKTAQLAACIGR